MLSDLQPEDLLRYGQIPELVGRLPVAAVLHELDEKLLVRILKEPKNSLLRQYQKFFDFEHVKLTFTEDAVVAVAEAAAKRGTGARGLRAILEDIMLDIMYELPSQSGISECIINRDVVRSASIPSSSIRKRRSPPDSGCRRGGGGGGWGRRWRARALDAIGGRGPLSSLGSSRDRDDYRCDDKTMWCRSIASGAIDLNQPLPDDIWLWYRPPEKAPKQPAFVKLEFENGIPVKMDGKRKPLGEIIPELNEIGGKHSIGKIDMFEDGIMDLKSREIYEAPGATLILKLHRDLEQFCLTKDEIQFKRGVDQKWANLIYHGMAYHPLKYDLDAFIEQSQKLVNGSYRIKLYKGNIDIVHRESKTSLFSPEIRSIKATGFDQRRCADAAFIRGLPFEILANRKKK